MKEKLNNLLRKVVKGLVVFLVLLTALIMIVSPKKPKTTESVDTTKKVEERKAKKDKIWKPKEIAEYNHAYVSKDDKNSDGSNIVINIDNVEKRENNIVITSYAPSTVDIKHAFEKYAAVRIFDVSGNDISGTLKDISVTTINDDGTEIIITGIDTTKAKWIEIMPYKTINDNSIVFELK